MSRGMLEYDNVVPMIQPIDLAGGANSPWVDMATAHRVAFLCQFGVVTSSAADSFSITVECATVGDTAAAEGTAVPFTYRLSGAVAANTWGAPTAATATGYAGNCTVINGKNIWVDVDPSQAQATVDTGRYLRLVFAQDGSAAIGSIMAFVMPRFHMATMISTTVST
jgi:hypothetical protein